MSDFIPVKIHAPLMRDHALEHPGYDLDVSRKWPVWVRLLVISAIAGALWTLIIGGVVWAAG